MSLAKIVQAVGREHDFRIVTTDRDIDDQAPYDSARPGQWVPVGEARVLYLSREEISVTRLCHVVNEVRPQVLYFNSFFDTWFTGRLLLARRLRRLPEVRFILAPRGEFSPGALGLKTTRKRAYIAGLKGAGVLDDVVWHASTPFEAQEIVDALGARVARHVHVAPDLGAMPDEATFETWQPREPGGPARICFISRVSPKKNLLGAIRATARMRLPARLTVYGPKEDAGYWEECRRAARELPEHIGFEVGGPLRPDAVHRTIAAHDVFFLPTLGENYGHVIPEALSVGLPVVISDRTPWRDLAAKGVGYDGPLDEAAFARELDRIADLDPAEMRALRETCRAFARSVLTDPAAVEANRRLFLG